MDTRRRSIIESACKRLGCAELIPRDRPDGEVQAFVERLLRPEALDGSVEALRARLRAVLPIVDPDDMFTELELSELLLAIC